MATAAKSKPAPLAAVGATVTWKNEAGKRLTGTVTKSTSRSIGVKVEKPKTLAGAYFLTVPFARDEVKVVQPKASSNGNIKSMSNKDLVAAFKADDDKVGVDYFLMKEITRRAKEGLLPVGTELGDGLRVGYGGVITGTAVLTAEQKKEQSRNRRAAKKSIVAQHDAAVDVGQLSAITKVLLSPGNSRHEEVKAKVKEMEPSVREKFCPPGYRGTLRDTFIKEGLLAKEQIDRAAATRKERDRAHKKEAETTAKQQAKQEKQAAKQAKPKKQVEERPAGATPADIAEKVEGATPRDVRVFLRKHADKFPKVNGFYAFDAKQTKAIVAGVKKEMK